MSLKETETERQGEGVRRGRGEEGGEGKGGNERKGTEGEGREGQTAALSTTISKLNNIKRIKALASTLNPTKSYAFCFA